MGEAAERGEAGEIGLIRIGRDLLPIEPQAGSEEPFARDRDGFVLGEGAWAWLRELRRGNQAAATAKLRGLWAGLREELPPSPPLAAELPEEITARPVRARAE